MATAVISANEAVHYAHSIWQGLPLLAGTIVLLGLFVVLTSLGIQESSRVAVAIFLIHIFTLSLLILVGVFFVLFNGLDVLVANFRLPTEGNLGRALLFGFAAAMLGISGFESSANFVEEQAEGVFPKTLRNMWIAVTVFNPGIALLALALVPIPEVAQHQETLLAYMGNLAGGQWLATLISGDATLVLSGAVLTSFVGVTGLVRRMTLDRCLPQFLLRKNRRGASHRIIIGFFLLGVSVLVITKGELEALAGVYTISFLAVMALFGIGNVLLKVKRARLPRPVRASWPAVIVGISAVLVGLIGNVIMNPSYTRVFFVYFLPTVLVVVIMLGRLGILKACLFLVQALSETIAGVTSTLSQTLRSRIERISGQQMVFFTRGDHIAHLNNAMLYVRRNEHTNRVKVVTVVEKEGDIPPQLEENLKFLDEAYPDIDIEFVVIQGLFRPALIQELSAKWKIPANFMFIGSPGDHFLYGLAELGGVRLII